MSVAVARRYGTVAADDNRQTVLWLAGIAAVVTILTSEVIWTRAIDFLAPEPVGHAEQDLARAFVADPEMRRLVKLTEESGPTVAVTPEKAQTLNEAIPFARGPISTATPFHAANTSQASQLTALKCLTQAVYYEAAYEPITGRRAVAQVVLNRAAHPAFPKSVCGVVYQGVNRPVCQFSFTCDGSLNRRPNPAKWKEAEEVAIAALGGYVEPSVGHSTHYHANYVSPYWAPKLVKISQIGAHIFYRWPGRWGMPGAFSGRYSGVEAIPAILPRSAIRNSGTGADGATLTGVSAGDPQIALQDRRADNDDGGRLDTSKGWELAIPAPEETSRASRMMARQQAGEFDIATKETGS